MMNMIEIGGLFVESYGCDMTGFIFYQVVGKTAKKVKVRRVNAAGNGRTLIAVKNDFYDDCVINKKVNVCASVPMISLGYYNAYLSDWSKEYKTTER